MNLLNAAVRKDAWVSKCCYAFDEREEKRTSIFRDLVGRLPVDHVDVCEWWCGCGVERKSRAGR